MILKWTSKAGLLLALTLVGRVAAVPIASNLTGTNGSTNFAHGQSFLTAAGGPFNQIRFNFFFNSVTPTATGNAYLLSSEYLGTPQSLSAATPGFLGVGAASGGFFIFDPLLTLSASTQYFLYTDTTQPDIIVNLVTDSYTDGSRYRSTGLASPYSLQPGQDTVFVVDGTAVASGVPELNFQGSALSFAMIACLVAMSRRRAIPAN